MYPNEANRDFKWKLMGEYIDGDGNVVGFWIQMEDGTWAAVGDVNDINGDDVIPYTYINEPMRDSAALQDLWEAAQMGGQGVAQTYDEEPNQQVAETNTRPVINDGSTTTTATDIQTGTEPQTTPNNDADTRTIAENTKKFVDNQGRLGDYLSDINKGIKDLNTELAKKDLSVTVQGGSGEGGTGEYTGPTADEIGEGVNDALGGGMGGSGTDPAGAVSGIAGAGNSIEDVEGIANTAKGTVTADEVPEDYQEKTDFEDKFSEMADKLPLVGLLTDSEVNASGSGSFDWVYKGESITFSIEPYSGIFTMMGALLQAVTALGCLLVVTRR
jgi:hypothetical protein